MAKAYARSGALFQPRAAFDASGGQGLLPLHPLNGAGRPCNKVTKFTRVIYYVFHQVAEFYVENRQKVTR
jgi:hypothetical protein